MKDDADVTKKCGKEAVKAIRDAANEQKQEIEAEKSSRFWESDGVNEENYRKYKGGAKVTNGKSKDTYCFEINTQMKLNNIHNRNPGMIATKIADLERQYCNAIYFRHNTGLGILYDYDLHGAEDDPETAYLDKQSKVLTLMKEQCHYFEELDPFMCNLPSSFLVISYAKSLK
ncbi:hypothetical protein BJ741DRAFT_673004 [Chytriomyces cf. hyalinus JEL632]|nr:hypothetical protein BJ741DRAFT_673004 [Chytriomyces cf. hyalinus JEL632]